MVSSHLTFRNIKMDVVRPPPPPPQKTEKFLETAEKEKNNNYLDACLKQRRHFTPFVASVDGLIRVGAKVTLKFIASRHTKKWKETYSCTCGYVKSRVAIALVLARHCCIQGFRLSASQIRVKRLQ